MDGITASSKYMLRKFKKAFDGPMGFWTDEDGMLISFVIDATITNWEDQIRDSLKCYSDEAFDPARAKRRFVEHRYIEDGSRFGDARKAWYCTDDPNDMPVIEYELLKPY